VAFVATAATAVFFLVTRPGATPRRPGLSSRSR
jgi:hypothetical protein